MNSYVGTTTANALPPVSLNSAFRVYLKTSDLASDSPATRFLFIDVNPASICTPGFGVDMGAQAFIHYPSSLHRGLGVLAFADSHVEGHKWVDPRTVKSLTGSEIYIPHNIASPNNNDLRWIADRTTTRK